MSEKDIEYAKKLQAKVQKTVHKGLKDKYQEFTQVSKEAESVLNNTTSDVETQGVMGEDGTKLRILVSSSMSLNLLRSYYKEAQRYGGHLVFNGLPNGSFKELLKLAQEIVGSSELGGIEIDDEALKKKAWAGILQFFMKHIHERDLLKRWYEVAELLPELAKLNIGIDYLELILTYTLIKIEKSDKIELEKILKSRLNNQQGEKLMTSLAHHWEQQGIEKGMQQGMQIGRNEGVQIGETKRTIEVAKNMYNAGSDIAFISKVTGLSISELNNLLKPQS